MRLFYIIIILTIYTASQAKVDERRIALVIGNAEYSTMGKLANPANDATDMVIALKQLGFEVISGTNLSKKVMSDKIRQFDKKLQSGDQANTIGLFYYAGHGMEVAGKNYLVPVDADMDYQEDAREEGVALNRIVTRMNYGKNRMNIVILDACRDNPLPQRDRTSAGVGWGAFDEEATGMFIAYGTAPGRKAADRSGNGRNGLFTRHILNNIYTKGKTLEQVFKATRLGVYQDSNGKQTTWQNNATFGDFYFIPPSIKPNTLPDTKPIVTSQPIIITKPSHQMPVQINTTKRQAGDIFKDCSDCPEMVVIPSGSFKMGSKVSKVQYFEHPIHRVNIKQFSMSTIEVTFSQWDACYKAGGCSHKPEDEGLGGGNHPVLNISWNDAKEYTKWLSQKTGKSYRLPTESEWEYAARSGSKSKYSWGNKIGKNKANCYSNICGDSYINTSPVKSFSANKFGLYDMHGNAREWVEDKWHDSYNGAPSDGSAWTSGVSVYRVLRGGSWDDGETDLRVSNRHGLKPTERRDDSGFRLARDK